MPDQLRVVLIGEFRTEALIDFIPALRDKSILIPSGSKGSGIINLVRARIARGLPTDVITLDTTASNPITCWEGDIVRLWVVRRRVRKAVRDAFREERQLLQHALSQTGADVCHANWTYEYALAAITQSAMPYVVTVRDHSWNILRWYGYRYLGLYVITQWVLRKAHFLTAISPYIAEYVSRIVKYKVPVVPNTLSDLVWSLKKQEVAKNPHLVIVSALGWSGLKNVKRALKAFRLVRLQFPQVSYYLLGTGLEVGGIAWHWANKHSLTQNVNFLGLMPYQKTLEIISRADVLFHPSLEESFGNPVAEAMALRIPVVAAKEAGGSRWLLDEGKCGNLVSGKSESGMATALLDVLANPGKIDGITSVANKHIRALCDPASIIEKYDCVYRKAINRQK